MNWYLINSKPSQEKNAAINVSRQGFDVFYPTRLSRRLKVGKSPDVESLFPGYFFARFDFKIHYRMVNYTYGVRKVVMFGSTPALVDEQTVSNIKNVLEESLEREETSAFCSGQVVRIKAGYFQGMEGIFDHKLSGRGRVALLLRALTFQARVTVPINHVVNT